MNDSLPTFARRQEHLFKLFYQKIIKAEERQVQCVQRYASTSRFFKDSMKFRSLRVPFIQESSMPLHASIMLSARKKFRVLWYALSPVVRRKLVDN